MNLLLEKCGCLAKNWSMWFKPACTAQSASVPGGVINIADPMIGTLVFIKLCYLRNFMSNECSMKCLWASENQRNWIFDIIYWALGRNQNHPNWSLANIFARKATFIYGLRYFIHFWKSLFSKIDAKFWHLSKVKNQNSIWLYVTYLLIKD